jgi:hypothetical protein
MCRDRSCSDDRRLRDCRIDGCRLRYPVRDRLVIYFCNSYCIRFSHNVGGSRGKGCKDGLNIRDRREIGRCGDGCDCSGTSIGNYSLDMIDLCDSVLRKSPRTRDCHNRVSTGPPDSSLNRFEVRLRLRQRPSRCNCKRRSGASSASRIGKAERRLCFVFSVLALALELVDVALVATAVTFANITCTSAAELG